MAPWKKRASGSRQWLISQFDPEAEEHGRSEQPDQCCLRIVVSFMLVITVLLTSVALATLIAASIASDRSWLEESPEEDLVQIMAELKSVFYENTIQILASNTSAIVSLTSPVDTLTSLAFTFDHGSSETPTDCLQEVGDVLTCLSWGDNAARLTTAELSVASGTHCMNVSLVGLGATACLSLDGRHVYAGPVVDAQKWPAERNRRFERTPYLSGYDGLKGVVERYWLTSDGAAIFVPAHVPLFWTFKDQRMCFTSSFEPPYYRSDDKEKLDLVVCNAKDTPTVHKAVANALLGRPEAVLNQNMIRLPIWSTWAKYKADISQLSVVDYATQIVEHGFPASQIEIDDKWESCYGESEFNLEAFPEPKEMVQQLHDLGFHVTLWTHPFVNRICPVFADADVQNYMVQDEGGNSSQVAWWNGEGGLIDFSNPEAAAWFTGRLLRIKEDYKIDGFKFDCGDMSYVPANGSLYSSRSQPAAFTRAYAEAAARTDSVEGRFSEMRTAFGTQWLGMALRMSDKESVWDDDEGLATLIPTLLTQNLAGYSYVIADMIGGDAYDDVGPDKELFIRWMQVATFMPIMQFSLPPWDFDQETVEIARKLVALHVELADVFYALARQRAASGIPINLPVWWIEPHDSIAQTIDSEFLLGEELLVAPVLERGATTRDVYLPAGRWREGFENLEGAVHEGPKWLRNHSAPLHHLPFFQRLAAR
ncbi:myogenesis-regulating glycosidase-like [Cloeon dipterum]|uniref:myogenesis-regulating glycosidase-like n=1 Tax=Cloeon dipterum TaxID=197152 RepID=UPI0032207835